MKRRQSGLTLVELMVTLAVAIIVLAIGIPAFTTMSARDMSAASVNALVTALQQARIEAIGRGASVTVAAESSSAWDSGWRVCSGAGDCRVCSDSTDDPRRIRCFAAVRPQIVISGVSGSTQIQFGSMGQRLLPDPAATPIVTFAVTAYGDNAKTKCLRVTNVIVTGIGQIRSESGTCP